MPRMGASIALAIAAAALASCASEAPPPQPVFASVAKSAPLRFQYQLIDGTSWLGAESLREAFAIFDELGDPRAADVRELLNQNA